MDTPRTREVPPPAPAQQAPRVPHIQDAAPFESPWDPPVRDHDLEGMTVEEALAKLDGALVESVYGHH